MLHLKKWRGTSGEGVYQHLLHLPLDGMLVTLQFRCSKGAHTSVEVTASGQLQDSRPTISYNLRQAGSRHIIGTAHDPSSIIWLQVSKRGTLWCRAAVWRRFTSGDASPHLLLNGARTRVHCQTQLACPTESSTTVSQARSWHRTLPRQAVESPGGIRPMGPPAVMFDVYPGYSCCRTAARLLLLLQDCCKTNSQQYTVP